ncbi:MAG: hypothetical protein IJJ59_13725, partial [Pseudobutyrivibrio sp.]|uniref:hypothetical protein n=1 Tax=Pseudobutyrivibrio sp. TaxID=2014367 RepID=UPI0025CEE2DC
RAALVPDSLNDGDSDPAASLDSTGEAAAADTGYEQAEATSSNDDEDIPALDIPEQFFNKE